MAIPPLEGSNARSVNNQVNRTLRRDLVEVELVASVSWMIGLRWFAGVGVIAASWIIRNIFKLTAPTFILCMIGAVILLYNLVFFIFVNKFQVSRASIRSYNQLAMWQTGLDWLAMTLLIHFSGGIESPAIFFFIFHIIIASIFFPRRSAYAFTILALTLITSIAFLEYFQIIPHSPVIGYLDYPLYRNGLYVSAVLIFFASTSVISAYLVTSIHDRLRIREQEIMDLSEDLRMTTIRLQALNDGARTVGSTLELKLVLDRLVKSATEAMGVRAGSVRLLDASGRQLEPVAVFGLSQAYLDKGPVNAETNPLARETLSGRVVNIPNAPENPLLQYPEEARQEGIQSMLSAPLIGKAGPLGIIRVYAVEPARFSVEDEAFLSAIAAQGSIAIENALAYKTIQELDNMKSQFIRTVTHELRSPVSVSRSLLRTITAGYAGDLNEQQRDILNRAGRRIEFLQKLIDDLLDLATGKAETKVRDIYQKLPLISSIEKVIKRYEVPAREKKIAIELVDCCAEEPVHVMATEEGLDRIFNNLIANAVKYTLPKGKVYIELRRSDNEVEVVVKDTGIGIPEESLAHLFEEFYRAPNAKDLEQEGTGLGLAIVKDTLKQYGGRISVKSKLNEGSKFKIIIPLVE